MLFRSGLGKRGIKSPHKLQGKGIIFISLQKLQGILTPDKKPAPRRRICAVDDSRMILNIYKSTLHELGFEPVLFEFPASALEWLATEKPDMVLTDLNMPDITGIDLAREIRRKYSAAELPVVMVTTQNEASDNKAALEAGVNDILHKPFTAESLRAVIGKYL